MQAADFLDDQSMFAALCRFTGAWLFERNNDGMHSALQLQYRMSEHRLQVCFRSCRFGILLYELHVVGFIEGSL